MNYMQILQLGLQIASVLDTGDPKLKGRKGDQLLYIVGRELAKRLQSRNPGIAQATGYADNIN